MNYEIKKILKQFVIFLAIFLVMPLFMKSFLPILPIFLLGIFCFITIIWQTILRTGNYDYKIYYPVSFIICFIMGLIFITIYLFGFIYPDTLSHLIFYVSCGFYIILVIYLYYYLKKRDLTLNRQ